MNKSAESTTKQFEAASAGFRTALVTPVGGPIVLHKFLKRVAAGLPACRQAGILRGLNRTDKELDFVVSHFAIPSKKYFGGYLPYVFTEQGVAMLSSVATSRMKGIKR